MREEVSKERAESSPPLFRNAARSTERGNKKKTECGERGENKKVMNWKDSGNNKE